MLQNQQVDPGELNLEDVQFANKHHFNISNEWREKFIKGAKEHGGIGKPSLVERKGLIREALNEHYDGISYTLAIEQRLNKAQAMLIVLLRSGAIPEGGVAEDIRQVIELLQ